MPKFIERISAFAQQVFTPVDYDIKMAKALVDRYETIKPELIKLGGKLENFGIRDEDGRMLTEYILFCPKNSTGSVKALLEQAGIQDLTTTNDTVGKLAGIGLMVEQGLGDSGALQEQINTTQFIIYRGKNMSLKDSARLRAS